MPLLNKLLGDMKKHHKTSKPTKTNQSTRNKISRDNLNETAKELELLSKKRLPNFVFKGELTGYEEDIRQRAVVLALGWYLRSLDESDNESKIQWLAPRAIAGALRLIKRDVLKELQHQERALQSAHMDCRPPMNHPSMTPIAGWPISTMQKAVMEAIHIAHKSKKISSSNAAIGREILLEGTPVTELARRLKIHRSAVAQQLGRVRRHLPAILENIEVPLNGIY